MSSPNWTVVPAPTPAPSSPTATLASAPIWKRELISCCTAPGVHQREDGVRGLATELQPEAAAPQVEEGGLAPVAGLRVAGEQDAGPVLDPDEEAALEQVGDDQDAIGVLDVDPHLFEVGVVEEALDDNPRLVDDQLLVVGPRGRGHQAPNRHSGSGEEKRAARPIDHA